MVESNEISLKNTPIKFLYSYGGKILPRYPDGKLRYSGGDTRVLSVDRSISFAELILKLGELCGGSSVSLRCQLPTEDLDALISITCDEDLANLIEEYDRASSLKIRAFISPPKSSSMKQVSSPPLSTTSSVADFGSDVSSPPTIRSGKEAHHYHHSPPHHHHQQSPPHPHQHHHHHHHHQHQVCVCQMSPKPVRFLEKSAGTAKHSYSYYGGGGGGAGCVPHHGSPRHMYLVHNGNHWQ